MTRLSKNYDYFGNICSVLQKINLDSWDKAIAILRTCWLNKRTVYVCGNGGSSAIASHFATDWSKGLSEKNHLYKFKTICLNDNTPLLTAIANDFSYESIFSKQIEYFGNRGDVLFLISGSGSSLNILEAAKKAKSLGVIVISISGFRGGEIKQLSDFHLNIESDDMQILEDIFSIFGHFVFKKLSNF
jgi:D-sedoheptulose 7-phosphate isomerase